MATIPRKERGATPASAQGTKVPIGNPLISNAKLKQIYATMLQCRILLERTGNLRRQSKSARRTFLGEAAAVGAALDLRREDWVASSQPDVLAGFVKGLPLSAIFAKKHGGAPKTAIAWDSEATRLPYEDESRFGVVPAASNPASALNLLAGVSLTLQAEKKGAIAMAFCGEVSGTGERWREALTFAGAHCLPLVVIQMKSPAKASKGKLKAASPRLFTEGHLCGLPVIPVDAHDVVAIYRVAYESIHKARHGGGPTLIEATEFTLPRANQMPSNAPLDAIAKMEEYLTAKGLFSEEWKQKVIDGFHRELTSAAKGAAKTSFGKRR